MARIYVASSWRNKYFPEVVARLREDGHEVYDVRNPPHGGAGFHWTDIDENAPEWSFSQYAEGLHHPKAERQFRADLEALEWADTCVLVLPCGRSAHTEAGWMAGAGKKGRILFGACRSSVEDVKTMRELGYDFWEWGAGSAFDPSKDDAWWRKQKDEIAKRPLPLRSCNGFIPGKFRLTGPKANPAPALDYAEKILRRADEVGVQTIVLGSGGARNLPKDWVKADPAAVEKGTRRLASITLKSRRVGIISWW